MTTPEEFIEAARGLDVDAEKIRNAPAVNVWMGTNHRVPDATVWWIEGKVWWGPKSEHFAPAATQPATLVKLVLSTINEED